MGKLEAEKINEAVGRGFSRIKEIGAENFEGLLISTNTKDRIMTEMCGSANSIEEMLMSVVGGLCEYKAYAECSPELALEIICSKIKIGVLRKLGEKNG